MSMFQQPIEKKLSAALGAAVTFDRLKLSVMSSSAEAWGLTVAGDRPLLPLLRIAHMRGEVSITKALAGNISIRSLEIENPVISIIRRAGGIMNLPKAPITPVAPASPAKPGQPSAMKLEMQSVKLVQGELNFEDEAAGYRLTAKNIHGEIRQQTGRLDMQMRIDSVERDGAGVLGPMEFTAAFSPLASLTDLAGAPMQAALKSADFLQGAMNSPGIATGRGDIVLTGMLEVSRLLALLPSSFILPPAMKACTFGAPINVSAKMQFDRQSGLLVENLSGSTTELRIALK